MTSIWSIDGVSTSHPFRDKVAIVTGATSGIGRALAQDLARAGAIVVVTGPEATEAEEVAAGLVKEGLRASSRAVDVTDADAVRGCVEETAAAHGSLDYLFNNAGVTVLGDAEEQTLEDWNMILDVNVRGVVHGVVAAYPLMVRQGSGHIVNVSSIVGLIPAFWQVPYCTSKHALVGLSQSLRVEGQSHGVRVSCVCPGYVTTSIKSPARLRGRIDPDLAMRTVPPFAITPEACARVILRGVRRNLALIVVPRHAQLLAFLQRVCPSFVAWLAGRALRSGRKRHAEALAAKGEER